MMPLMRLETSMWQATLVGVAQFMDAGLNTKDFLSRSSILSAWLEDLQYDMRLIAGGCSAHELQRCALSERQRQKVPGGFCGRPAVLQE